MDERKTYQSSRTFLPPSLWARYQFECYGRLAIESEVGFVVYEINGEFCSIIDIFTVKEARRTGAFYQLCKQVHDIAKERGCKTIVGWIPLDSKTSHLSLRAQLALGMKVVGAEQNILRLERAIE